MRKQDKPDTYPTPTYAWYTVGLLVIVYTFSYIDRQILGLLGPAIKADFSISDTQFGLLTGIAFAIFYGIFGLFCARIADTGSRRGLIAVGLFLWSLMTTASAFARSFTHLFLLRVGVGVGEATLAPSANSLIADSFPKEKLSTAMSVYSMGIPIGSGLAFIVGGAVISWAGTLPDISFLGFEVIRSWQKTFILVGLPGLVLTLMIITIREPSRKGLAGPKPEPVPLAKVWAQFKQQPRAYGAIFFGLSAIATLSYGTLTFLAFFMQRIHGIDSSTLGYNFGFISLIGGVLGLILGGRIADILYRKGRNDAHILALLASPLGYFLPALIYPQASDLSLMWGMLFIQFLFINLPTGAAYAAISMITPNQMRGQFTAAFIMVVSLLGYSLGPLLVGVFNDYVFADEMAIDKSLMLLALITTPISIFFMLFGRKQFAAAVLKHRN